MKNIIERIHKRTTEYSHPSQATTTANALDLLSSGIYTEEERFIFELLQNAVDSFDPQLQATLSIQISFIDNLLIFMHNGTPFSERDIEGLCDIGNGNKVSDAKKIGYKGIGFKSVFMHSQRVTILTGNTCFKFDKKACETIATTKGMEYENVKMPWQIIPIPADVPSNINTNGFNVITYIETTNKQSLKRKVEKLLNETRFLLFLKVPNLNISFWDEQEEILCLSKQQDNEILQLSKNGEIQSNWLIHSTDVKLTPEIKESLIHDNKTPTKLKESESVEISFAIALDKDKNIIPIQNAVMYTYLPTSFSFGLNFIVNANFITDAGRQQIVKDCAWNEFIFAQIPGNYLNWIANYVATKYSGWYKVLPICIQNDDELSEAYAKSLTNALETISFVKTIKHKKILLKNALVDNIGLNTAIPNKIFNIFTKAEISPNVSSRSLVSSEVGQALQQVYGIANVNINHAYTILENADRYLKRLSDEESIIFLNWLKNFAQNQNNDFKRMVSYSKILPSEKNNLIEPKNSFFPSNYSDENPDISADAKIIRKSLTSLLSDEMTNWFAELGVQEMSNLSVIEKVLCKNGYINKENAIDILRFIFETNKKENVFTNISSIYLSNIKVLTTNGTLKNASELYLSNCYNPVCKIQDTYFDDIFVSEEYPENESEYAEWSLFFKKLGCNDDIKLSLIKYSEDSWVMQMPSIKECVRKAKIHEYNEAYDGRKFPLGCAGGICIYAMSSPMLTNHPSNRTHEFYTHFWGRIFSSTIPIYDESIYGTTGYDWSGYPYGKDAPLRTYLGKSFIEWFVKSLKVIPASDGELHYVDKLLINSDYNIKTFGAYFPVLKIEGTLTNEWASRLPFKKSLSLTEYLIVLSRISQDEAKEQISANKEKINRIYEQIADTFDFSEEGSDFTLTKQWGKSHKILSKEGTFEYPSSLFLLSSRLSGVDIDNQVFHGKHLENERFASFMNALGVNIIDNYHVDGIENAQRILEINESLIRKVSFFTSVAVGDSFTEETWREERSKMYNAIESLEFYQVDSIVIYYGLQGFSKTTFSKENKFYFVGQFGLANQELLHETIMEILNFPKKVRTIFLTILQMNDISELKEYIKQKGYDTSFIEDFNEITIGNHKNPIMSGENAPWGGLTQSEMRHALEEAKECILEKLSNDGFNITKKRWDGWTCIDGVEKNGIEYPLVIRSNKSQRSTCLSPSDWNQLMKPNAMFAVVTSNGVGTISLREILKSKERISIKFSSENIDDFKHTQELAHVFAYFKGIQFDFDNYIHPTINQWERFMTHEQSSDELPIATSSFALPE